MAHDELPDVDEVGQLVPLLHQDLHTRSYKPTNLQCLHPAADFAARMGRNACLTGNPLMRGLQAGRSGAFHKAGWP